MNRRRALTLTLATVSAAALLAGCSSSTSTSSGSSTPTASPTTAAPTSTATAPSNLPTSSPSQTGVKYSGSGGTGVMVTGVTQANPTVTIAKGAPDPSALIANDLVVGTGAAASQTSTVTVQYVGYQLSSGVKFDSSWDRGQPLTFGLTQVIPGWTQGLNGMKAGGVRVLNIPQALAYGQTPPSATTSGALVFVVELLKVA